MYHIMSNFLSIVSNTTIARCWNEFKYRLP